MLIYRKYYKINLIWLTYFTMEHLLSAKKCLFGCQRKFA